MLHIHSPVSPPSFALRPDLPSPPTYHIDFHHPAYPPGEDRLLRLAAFDHVDGGLHHGVALDALAIVAGNAIGGFLSRTRAPEGRIEEGRCEVLRERRYWFIILWPEGGAKFSQLVRGFLGGEWTNISWTSPDDGPINEPYKYPICPSFSDWLFPHDNVPLGWCPDSEFPLLTARKAVSSFTNKVIGRDGTCRVSGYSSAVQACHLVPRAESEWFLRNSMDNYNADDVMRGDYALDDSANAVAMRMDLHAEFDALAFVFAPKTSAGQGLGGYSIHCLIPTPDILPTFHNHLTQPLVGVAPEFLYARFAYAIFPRLSAFLVRGKSAKLVVRVKADAGEGLSQEIVDVPVDEFRVPKSRSASPKKRGRRGENEEAASNVRGDYICLGYESDAGTESSGSSDGGRSRKRERTAHATNENSSSSEDPLSPNPYFASIFKHLTSPSPNDSKDPPSPTTPPLPPHITPYIWAYTRWHPDLHRIRRLKRSWILEQRPKGYVQRRWNGQKDDLEGYLAGLGGEERMADFEGEAGGWEDKGGVGSGSEGVRG
ncbi:MAG: hypothetical protein M1813_002172 [Trichoglossum hirsutum]|nr:MAG: hypothetical protein M1813_002172 [Trichoglossum hirsutum]